MGRLTDIVRGAPRNPGQMSQVTDFSGLRYERGITPTDIDVFLDFSGEVFIIGELKYGDADLPKGQRLALQRLADACHSGGVATLVFVAEHNVPAASGRPIPVASLFVRECYYPAIDQWLGQSPAMTVRELIDGFKKEAKQ